MRILRPYPKQIKKPFMVMLVAATATVAVASSPIIIYASMQHGNVNSQAAKAFKQSLKNQVDTPSGQPRDGRDPAIQAQTSLAQAASSPNGGEGHTTSTPAAGVSRTKGNRAATKPSDVYGDPAKTGIDSAGCYINYGTPGKQCVSVSLGDPSMGGMLMCDAVRKQFPNGVRVNGIDRFALDTNHDGTACGPKDI